MGAIAFDTYAFIKKLEKSGFKEEQAEALSGALKEVQEAHLEELATKGDILELKRDMKDLKRDVKEFKNEITQDIKELRQETKQDILGLKQSTKLDIAEIKGELLLLKWMLGFMFAGIFSLVLKAFFV